MSPQDLTASRLQDLSGVLVVDKPEGPTSHDVVTITRRALGVSRVGHTGTLDPMATGVLPLVIGRATRLAQFLTASDKTYEATIAFGRATDTFDASGTIVSESALRPTRDQLETVLGGFRGTFDQTPPVYSAKNIDGERSYDLARKGRISADTRPKAVAVTVRHLEILAFDGASARLELQVTAGFYVRSLAQDVGAALECGAVLTSLRRTRSGEFGLNGAVPLAEVLQSPLEALRGRLLPLSALLAELPSVTLRGTANVARVKNGVEVAPDDVVAPLASLPPLVRLLGPDGDLVGLAKPAQKAGFLHGWVVLGA